MYFFRKRDNFLKQNFRMFWAAQFDGPTLYPIVSPKTHRPPADERLLLNEKSFKLIIKSLISSQVPNELTLFGQMVSYLQKVTYLGHMAGNHPFEMLASSFCIPDNELSPCAKSFSNKGIPDKTPSTISNLKAPDNFVPFQKYDRNEVLGLSQKNGHLQSLQEQVKYCWKF